MSIKISFLDLNIIKREIEMKIQAKDLKVGDVFSAQGKSNATITALGEKFLKNGKRIVQITAQVPNTRDEVRFYGQPEGGTWTAYLDIKEDTKVLVK